MTCWAAISEFHYAADVKRSLPGNPYVGDVGRVRFDSMEWAVWRPVRLVGRPGPRLLR